MATAELDYFCHKCQIHIGHVTVKCTLNQLSLIKDYFILFRTSNVHVAEKVL
jgi:hypothetical protein